MHYSLPYPWVPVSYTHLDVYKRQINNNKGYLMVLKDYLRILAARDGSDLYLTVDAPPAGKFQGSLKALDKIKMTPESVSYTHLDVYKRQIRCDTCFSDSCCC